MEFETVGVFVGGCCGEVTGRASASRSVRRERAWIEEKVGGGGGGETTTEAGRKEGRKE